MAANYQVKSRLMGDEIVDRRADGDPLHMHGWRFIGVQEGDTFTIIALDGAVFTGRVSEIDRLDTVSRMITITIDD